jgi:hypothetical protein
MDSKDVEEIFKGVLTDESQESQESTFPLTEVGPGTSTPVHTSVPHSAAMVSPSGSVTHPGNSMATYCMSSFCIVGAFDVSHICYMGGHVCTSFSPSVCMQFLSTTLSLLLIYS